jgi:mxaK protein
VRAAQLEEAGQSDAALNAYRELQAVPELGQAARYNAANVLMRQAGAVKEASNAGQALPLIELAKQGYRDVLRHDPAHWEARYNLERAQRLQPEPEDMDAPITEPRNDAERAATTMRGVAPGLP